MLVYSCLPIIKNLFDGIKALFTDLSNILRFIGINLLADYMDIRQASTICLPYLQ